MSMFVCIDITYVWCVIFILDSMSSVIMWHYCQARVKLFWPVTAWDQWDSIWSVIGWDRDQPRTITGVTILISHHLNLKLSISTSSLVWCLLSHHHSLQISQVHKSRHHDTKYTMVTISQTSGVWHNFIKSSGRHNIESESKLNWSQSPPDTPTTKSATKMFAQKFYQHIKPPFSLSSVAAVGVGVFVWWRTDGVNTIIYPVFVNFCVRFLDRIAGTSSDISWFCGGSFG